MFADEKRKDEDMPNPIKAIRRIQVHKLFGTYNYSLCPSPQACNADRLMILYGDNGSGKTTILRTIFHLLAPEDSEGHKAAVAKTPFGRFEVDFTSGDHVWAERREGRTTGTFTMALRFARKKEATVEFIANEEGSIKPISEKHNLQIRDFLAKLRQLNVGLYFLSDDRTVRLAGRERREMPFMRPELLDDEVVFYQDLPPQIARMRRATEPEKRAQQLLLESIKRAEM
jgi:energy-coupling factor transporter ATP-binding protein EcfA2